MNQEHKKPCAYTLIYWLIQDKKINPEEIFIFSELYWPSFVTINDKVFLKERFSEQEYSKLMQENENPEYWINLCIFDEFFSETSDSDRKSLVLAQILVKIWKIKLGNDFPNMHFTVELLWNEEYGDCGLTFYQTKESFIQSTDEYKEITSPHIKENKIVDSPIGPRSGISRIRKPRQEEIPQ